MNVVMVGSEAVPFAKVGGLGDVLGSLPKALVECGVSATVVLPWYRSIAAAPQFHIETKLQGKLERYPVGQVSKEGVRFLFVGLPDFLGDELYGGDDESLRFIRFAQAAWAVVRHLGRSEQVDVVHCHDWQAALIPTLSHIEGKPWPTVQTIHNLAYQGVASEEEFFTWTGLPREDLFHMQGLEFHGDVNVLKGAIVFADRVTTVSASYAEEIRREEYGAGLHGVLEHHKDRLLGIVNGIDTTYWNPATDTLLAKTYHSASRAGKRACETTLARELDLEQPILGMVSRFVEQKGVDVIIDAAPALLELGYCLALLGSGEAELEAAARELAEAYPDRVSFTRGYDEPLAHRIYAGSRAFLMPSRFEPCGLSQLIAMRYGTVPIAHAVGGLRDTIDDGNTGVLFSLASADALLEAVARLKTLDLQEMQRQAMQRDSSWGASARQYQALYKSLVTHK